MGLYDILKDGEQVKCFFLPVFGTTQDTHWSVGGGLRHYNIGDTVPYKTLYYNYGEDFMCFDFWWTRWRENEEEVLVHIFKNGVYQGSFDYRDLMIRGFFTEKTIVIDKGGSVVNIKSFADFAELINDVKDTANKENELREQFKAQGKLVVFPTVADYKEKGFDFAEYWQNENEIDALTWDIFQAKWYKSVEDVDAEVHRGWTIGSVYSGYKEGIKPEYVWYNYIPYYVEKIYQSGSTLSEKIAEYFVWAEKNDIQIDKVEVEKFFLEHFKECPEEVYEEYIGSEEYTVECLIKKKSAK